MSGARKGLTITEVMALPATVDLETGNRALGIGRTLGYSLAQRDAYPCRVVKVGTAYRVATADLRHVLGIQSLDAA